MRIRTDAPHIPLTATTASQSQVAPIIKNENNLLILQNGENVRRSWGCVKVTSTLVVRTRTFVVVHVGVCHKYGGGQQWYYFEQPAGESLQRRTAPQLSKRRKQQVVDALNAGKAPEWAKAPFSGISFLPIDPDLPKEDWTYQYVLADKDKKKPQRYIRYKAVAVVDGEFRSIYDGSEYALNKTRRQKVEPDHNGGFYVYRSAEMAGKVNVPSDSVNVDAPRAILKCEVWGRCEIYGGDLVYVDADEVGDAEVVHERWDGTKGIVNPKRKEAWTYCRPVAIIK